MRQEIEQLEREVQKRDACSKLEKQELSLRYERRMQEEQLQMQDCMNQLKRERQNLEDHLFQEQSKSRQLNDQADQLLLKTRELTAQRDELERRVREGEALRIQMDRLGQVEIVNRKMKEQKREDDFQI